MVIEESNLKFKFAEGVHAIKFDGTDFYRRKFNRQPSGKGVDILADSPDSVQFIEIKNCTGNESSNIWRTSINNTKISSAPRDLDIGNRDSFDIEMSKKVASTIDCLFGAWSKSENDSTAIELMDFWNGLNQAKVMKNKKKIFIILFLEGDFDKHGPQSRSKKMMMQRIKESIEVKLNWLNCKVAVVDSNTYRQSLFEIVK